MKHLQLHPRPPGGSRTTQAATARRPCVCVCVSRDTIWSHPSGKHTWTSAGSLQRAVMTCELLSFSVFFSEGIWMRRGGHLYLSTRCESEGMSLYKLPGSCHKCPHPDDITQVVKDGALWLAGARWQHSYQDVLAFFCTLGTSGDAAAIFIYVSGSNWEISGSDQTLCIKQMSCDYDADLQWLAVRPACLLVFQLIHKTTW